MRTGATQPRRIEHELGWHNEDFSDFELRFVVPGRLMVKKNHQKIIKLGKFSRIAPGTNYEHWQRDAVASLAQQWSRVSRVPVPDGIALNLCVVTYLADRRGWPDLCATYEGPQDVLEVHKRTCKTNCRKHAGVIANDKWICGHTGSDRRIDPGYPRTELTLTPHRQPIEWVTPPKPSGEIAQHIDRMKQLTLGGIPPCSPES